MRSFAVAASQLVRPTGWGWLAALALAFVAGYAAGWQQAVVVAWAGTAATVVALALLLRRVPHGIALEVPVERVTVGQRAVAALVHRNESARRRGSVSVDVPVGARVRRVVVPAAPAGRTSRVDVPLDTRRRAVITVGPARTVRADPLGLFHRRAEWPGTARVFVHPTIQLVPSASSGFVRDLEGSITRDLTESDMAFHALREYVPGDHPRAIHWRSSARSQRLLVRQFEQTRRSHVVVVLAGRADAYADDDEYELAVSACGSLAVRAIRDGRTTTVVTAEDGRHRARALATHTPRHLLDDLAGIRLGAAADDLVDTATRAGTVASDASLVFLLAGSTTSSETLNRALRAFGPSTQGWAIVCCPGQSAAYQSYESLSRLRIGGLDDLAPALTRAAA